MSIELPPGTADYNDELNPPTQKRQVLSIVLFFLGLLLTFLAILNFLANQLVWWIPVSVEQQLGSLIVPTFEQQSEPSATQDTLNQLLDRLEEKLPDRARQERDYQVLYIPQDVVNALAIPGDRVIIYQGLLEKMESENELMMVLGHELGHFVNRDHLRSLGRGIVFQIVLTSVFGDFGSLESILLTGVENFSTAQLSQSQETQADEVGLELLNQVYGHVAGATDFFIDLSQETGSNFDFLSTHPAPQKRVKHLEKLIQKQSYRLDEKQPLPPSLTVET